MYESQLNDKIKYWQYHLKKNKKNDVKDTLKKTPEKKKTAVKSLYQSHQSNLLNTIDKLKTYLHQEVIAKTIEPSFKKEKEPKKVHNKEIDNQNKTSKSISMQGTLRLSKPNHHKKKIDFEAINMSKSKSKSKSKPKILKPKKSKEIKSIKETKEVKQTKFQRATSPKKASKKKRNKSPISKNAFSIKIEPSNIQQWKFQKRGLETVNLKTEKSRYETQSSNFRLWEQHEQIRYNMKRKCTKILSSYIHSFSTFITYSHHLQKPSRIPFMQRSNHIPFSLQNMIRSQESKLLDLRKELSRLKDSSNLNESLELIISKVNDNISSLKKIEYSENEKNGNNQYNAQLSTYTVRNQVNSFHNSTQSVEQSQQSSFSEEPVIREPMLLLDSLTISNDEASHFSSKYQLPREVENLKEESSINLLDSKFLNVTLNHHSPVSPSPAQIINISLITSHQAVLMNFQNQSTLLLSASAKSQSKLLSQESQLEQKDFGVHFTVNEVKFHPQCEQEKIVKKQNFQIHSEQENMTLLNSINSILNGHARQFQIEKAKFLKVAHNYSSQQKNHVFGLIFNDLLNEMLPFLGNHQSLLEKLFQLFSSQEQPSIQYKNQYLLQLANKLLIFASENFNFFERLSQPLGVEPFVNLRYIRISLIDEYALDGFATYSQEDYQSEINEQMQAVEEKAEILLRDHLDLFDQTFGYQDISYQIILNRCLYEALNNILDKFRPFGSNGLPVFHTFQSDYRQPSLKTLKKKVELQLNRYLDVRLDCQLDSPQSAFDIQRQVADSLIRNMKLLSDEIQQDFQGQSEDSMERYELMLMIENYLFSQQFWIIHQCMSGNTKAC